MKLFVCIPSVVKQTSILCETSTVVRLTVLLEGGVGLWSDDSSKVKHTPDSIKAAYLTPNGIPVSSMGECADAPGTWWVCVDSTKLRMEDFYTVAEAEAAGVFVEDPTALAWKDHYIFLHGTTGEDLVGSLDYLGTVKGPAQSILKNMVVV